MSPATPQMTSPTSDRRAGQPRKAVDERLEIEAIPHADVREHHELKRW